VRDNRRLPAGWGLALPSSLQTTSTLIHLESHLMPRFRMYGSLIFLLMFAVASSFAQNAKPSAPAPVPAGQAPTEAGGGGAAVVRAVMRNIEYHLTDRIIVHIVSLDGKLEPKPGEIPVFDDRNSFGLEVDSATIILNMTALTNDLNDYVFAKPDAPLKHLNASTQGDQLVLKGLLASKGGIPFETSGTISLTPEGMIRVHTTKVKALKLPVKGLLDILGLDTETLLSTKKVEGVSVDKDDLILDPQKILPPPELRGHLTALKIENAEIHLTFGPLDRGAASAPVKESCGAKNYLHFRGGSVRFGKLTMADTDLELLDSTPADPFDFAIEHYNEQLVAGYSKMTQSGGVCVHMPDYNKLNRRLVQPTTPAPEK
jgi:hypothetical protein